MRRLWPLLYYSMLFHVFWTRFISSGARSDIESITVHNSTNWVAISMKIFLFEHSSNSTDRLLLPWRLMMSVRQLLWSPGRWVSEGILWWGPRAGSRTVLIWQIVDALLRLLVMYFHYSKYVWYAGRYEVYAGSRCVKKLVATSLR